ncbi:hypothetical protein [Salipaludibacillus daqingensis]|uniref:hypothetical protein n=1 Tax=Salipaludibacillus daqingensis TaxID=3041001 RepID=UPI002476FCEC|nr:hypothetical protein [Salipaludibacillus daqingensis]
MERTNVTAEQEELVREEEKVVEDHGHGYGASLGTWVALGIVGAVIFATFILMFAIYFARL